MRTVASIFRNSSRRPAGVRAYLFPGQGSQRPGMGAELFDRHPDLVARADAVLGYSVREVCLEQPADRLRRTEYTQPALYVLEALHYFDEVERSGHSGDFMAGHSLGQFASLFAADVFDFEAGLEMVRVRGELSGKVGWGAMAAVLGLYYAEVDAMLRDGGYDRVTVANYNSPRQLVVTGAEDQLARLEGEVGKRPGGKFVLLPIRGAFHSPSMKETAARFRERIEVHAFRSPRVPVLSCATGRPFPAERPDTFAALLADQLVQPVRWIDVIQYLRAHGVTEFVEAGPGDVLHKLNGFICEELPAPPPAGAARPGPAVPASAPAPRPGTSLGAASFRAAYGARLAYAVGGLEPGLVPLDTVLETAREGILAYHTPRTPSPEAIEDELAHLARAGGGALPVGLSLSQLRHPGLDAILEAMLRHGILNLELRDPVGVGPGLVGFRRAGGRILVRTGRFDVAREFLAPLPGDPTPGQAVASDLAVRVDFTEPLDSSCGAALLPLMLELRDELGAGRGPEGGTRIGLGEGLGTPRGVAAAFRQGADFVVTVGVNACTREARLSARAKDLLQGAGPQDFVFAPDGQDFEQGLRRAVLGRGLLFPGRAQLLFELSRTARRLDDLDGATRSALERHILKQPAAAILDGQGPGARGPSELAHLARWYLDTSRAAAFDGRSDWAADYSIPGDVGLGAWNLHARGTELEAWRDRTPERIASHLMSHAGALLERSED